MHPSQSGTIEGIVSFLAAVDLTNKEGYLLKLIDGTGECTVGLPTADANPVQFACVNGDAAGESVGCQPLTSNRSVRLRASGAIVGGVAVVVENGGKVKTSTGLAGGTYYVVGYAEEDGADGDLIRVRPAPRVLVV